MLSCAGHLVATPFIYKPHFCTSSHLRLTCVCRFSLVGFGFSFSVYFFGLLTARRPTIRPTGDANAGRINDLKCVRFYSKKSRNAQKYQKDKTRVCGEMHAVLAAHDWPDRSRSIPSFLFCCWSISLIDKFVFEYEWWPYMTAKCLVQGRGHITVTGTRDEGTRGREDKRREEERGRVERHHEILLRRSGQPGPCREE